MDIFKEKIIELLKKKLKLEKIELTIPPDSSMGDYAFPCFVLAKTMKKNPAEIAKELAGKIKTLEFVIDANGPYLNFFIDKKKLGEAVLREIFERKNMYGSKEIGKKALIEHTSINPNASPHVGRARNALIGDSITRLLKFQGYKTDVHYFINDVGKQIALLALFAGHKKISFKDLLKEYVKASKKLEKDPKTQERVFFLLNKLEEGDEEIKKLFRNIVDTCINGQKEILSDLEIEYDSYDYESEYLWNKKVEEVLKLLKKTGKLHKDEEKRTYLDQSDFKLAMKSPVLVLTRADQTSLYPLRDIAYHIYKAEQKADKNVLVLGEDHKLYFEQIKAAMQILNYKFPEVVHYSFILLKEGKMSTRKGNVVLLEDFMKEAVKKAKKEILKRNKKIDKDDSEKLSKVIGYGAIKYSILKVSPDKNVVFEWNTALNFEGDSAPYLHYTHARICSILRKSQIDVNDEIGYGLLNKKEEIEIVKELGNFKEIIEKSTKQLCPHIVANYVYNLSKIFNEFYHKHNILKEKEDLKKARLLLIDCVRQVLKNGLSILGIIAPERM